MTHLINVRSPGYNADVGFWGTWRQAVAANQAYVRSNLQRLPGEKLQDYDRRLATVPTPAFIKATLREVLTGIFAQMELTTRSHGPRSLQEAVAGNKFGVDGAGTSMNYFMIMKVLRELLIMRRVGVFVDRPPLPMLPTLKDVEGSPPYAYTYTAEQILAWHIKPGHITPEEVLLRRDVPITHEGTGIAVGTEHEYLYLRRVAEEVVRCDIFNHTGDFIGQRDLNLPVVPFILLELDESVIQDVIGHQNALLNLGSSNIAFALAANMSVYTEQSDMGWLMQAIRQKQDQDAGDDDAESPNTDGASIELGLNRGRRYMQNAQPPAFISPDNINLERAVKLYEQLRDDIRRIILLAIENVSVRGMATATSLMQSQAATSNGLTALAVTLERAERQLAVIWSGYEAVPHDYVVKYPTNFQVISRAERLELINSLAKLRELTTSRRYQDHISRAIATLVVGPEAVPGQLDEITAEIKQAPAAISSPDTIAKLAEAGILPREYAVQLLNLPADAAVKANLEHAERLRRIAEAQSVGAPSAARGNPDGIEDATDEKTLSQTSDLK